MRPLHVLCAGAVQGLVAALAATFEERTGATVQARFGAVGAMKEALMGGAPCDVLIVTDAMLRALQGNGAIEADRVVPIGRVRTGVAARAGDPQPDVGTDASLKAALLAAPAFYVPDILKSTAGQHIASILERLDIRRALGTRLMVYPNGAAAMEAMSLRGVAGALGSTQVTEILYTPGLLLAGLLPAPFDLSTVYSAGVSSTAAEPDLASIFLRLVAGSDSAELRRECGFETLDD